MLPARIASQEITHAALVQEVLDGVKEGRKLTKYDTERDEVDVK